MNRAKVVYRLTIRQRHAGHVHATTRIDFADRSVALWKLDELRATFPDRFNPASGESITVQEVRS